MIPEAAVAILHARGDEDSVLLMRRAEREGDPWSGHWSFPGGRREESDVDLLHTALRELDEECGIVLERDNLEIALGTRSAHRRNGPVLPVSPFVFRIESELDAVPDQLEAVETLWVRLGVLRDPAKHSLRPVPGLPPATLFPSVALPEMPLWGFTYRLINEWQKLLPEDASVQTQQLACAMLADFKVIEGWTDRAARVAGEIPVEAVCDRLKSIGPDIPPVNMVEVRPDLIRIVGLTFEEYVIRAEV